MNWKYHLIIKDFEKWNDKYVQNSDLTKQYNLYF